MCCVPWFNDSIDEARDARPKLKHPREKDLFTLNVSGLRSEQTKQREQARRTEGELGEKRSRDRQRERERMCIQLRSHNICCCVFLKPPNLAISRMIKWSDETSQIYWSEYEAAVKTHTDWSHNWYRVEKLQKSIPYMSSWNRCRARAEAPFSAQ